VPIGGTVKYHVEESLLFFQVNLCCGILQEVKLKAVSMVDMCRTCRSQKQFGKKTQKTLSSSLGLPRRSCMDA
jgi:hypothetical protein